MVMTKKEKVNEIFSKVCYIIVILGNFMILLLVSHILFPFAVLKSLSHSAYDGYAKFRMNKIHVAILALLLRPLYLYKYIIEDIGIFWKSCYKETSDEENEKQSEFVTRDIIMAFRRVLVDYRYKFKKKIISEEDLYKRLNLHKQKKKTKNALLMQEKTKSLTSFDGAGSDNSGEKDNISNGDVSPVNHKDPLKASTNVSGNSLNTTDISNNKNQ